MTKGGTKLHNSETSGLTPKGAKTRRAILKVARNTLVSNADGNLSIKQVAEEVGISLGNLQYYFPTKSELIRGVLQEWLESDLDALDSAVRSKKSGPRQRLLAFIDQQLASSQKIYDIKLIVHIWNAAIYDEKLNEALAEWYANYRRIVKDMLLEANPQISTSQLDNLAAIVIAVIEGESVINGASMPARPELKNLHSEIRLSILRLAGLE